MVGPTVNFLLLDIGRFPHSEKPSVSHPHSVRRHSALSEGFASGVCEEQSAGEARSAGWGSLRSRRGNAGY